MVTCTVAEGFIFGVIPMLTIFTFNSTLKSSRIMWIWVATWCAAISVDFVGSCRFMCSPRNLQSYTLQFCLNSEQVNIRNLFFSCAFFIQQPVTWLEWVLQFQWESHICRSYLWSIFWYFKQASKYVQSKIIRVRISREESPSPRSLREICEQSRHLVCDFEQSDNSGPHQCIQSEQVVVFVLNHSWYLWTFFLFRHRVANEAIVISGALGHSKKELETGKAPLEDQIQHAFTYRKYKQKAYMVGVTCHCNFWQTVHRIFCREKIVSLQWRSCCVKLTPIN